MMPGVYGEAEYTAFCRGMERMAHLYKNRGGTASGKKKNRAEKLFHYFRRGGVRNAMRRYRVIRSGVDRQLPVNDLGNDAPEGKRDYFSTERIAVYTAEFGGYDEIQEPVIRPDNIDYFIITDDILPPESCWKPINPSTCIPREYLGNPSLSNRWCKMHPHELFPGYRYSVYIDANFLVVSDFTELINRMEDFPVAMFRHKNRDCVYEEIKACMIKNKAPKEALRAHGALLKEHGVPKKYGLLEAPVIARRHQERVCIDLMDHWWRAFLEGCGRDQIALVDALWELQIKPSRLSALGPNLSRCDLFIGMHHNQQKPQ